MRLSRLILLAVLVAGVSSCDTPQNHEQRLQVIFPAVKLDHGEYIQKFDIAIYYGMVTSVNRSIQDWDYSVTWDNPDQQNVGLLARHFSSGLADVRKLDGLFTIAVDPTNSPYFKIETVLNTQKTDPTGGGTREINIPAEQMILKPAPRR